MTNPAAHLRKYLASRRFLRGKPVRVHFGCRRHDGRTPRTWQEAEMLRRRDAAR